LQVAVQEVTHLLLAAAGQAVSFTMALKHLKHLMVQRNQ
jgi:hypothetical protein